MTLGIIFISYDSLQVWGVGPLAWIKGMPFREYWREALLVWLLAERTLLGAMGVIRALIPELPKRVRDWQRLRTSAFRQKYLSSLEG